MISVLFYGTFLINVLLIISKRKSSVIALLSWVVLLLAYSGNIRSGFSDLTYYRIRYYEGLNDMFFSDKGYVWLADYFSNRGVSFQVFLGVIFFISSLLIFYISIRLKCNSHLLITLLSLFYFFYSMEVLRFFIASCIALLAYYYLSQKKNILFVLILSVAATFHLSIIYLLPFLVFYLLKTNKTKIILLVSVAIGMMILNFLNGNNSDYLFKILGPLFGNESTIDRISFYTGQSTRLGFLVYDLYFCFNLMMIIQLRKLSNLDRLCLVDFQSNFIEMVYQQNIFSIIFLPLIMFNVTFVRYIIFSCILNFLVFSILYEASIWKKIVLIKQRTFVIASLGVISFTILWWILRENVLLFYEALIPNLFN